MKKYNSKVAHNTYCCVPSIAIMEPLSDMVDIFLFHNLEKLFRYHEIIILYRVFRVICIIELDDNLLTVN